MRVINYHILSAVNQLSADIFDICIHRYVCICIDWFKCFICRFSLNFFLSLAFMQKLQKDRKQKMAVQLDLWRYLKVIIY